MCGVDGTTEMVGNNQKTAYKCRHTDLVAYFIQHPVGGSFGGILWCFVRRSSCDNNPWLDNNPASAGSTDFAIGDKSLP